MYLYLNNLGYKIQCTYPISRPRQVINLETFTPVYRLVVLYINIIYIYYISTRDK